MKLQIGRFGLGLVSGEVQSADSSDSKLTLVGRTAYASLAESLALRQQILGYSDNPDEDFVPVVWDEYPAVNGYYRVAGVSVDAKRGLAPRGKVTFSVDLERVLGYAAPLIEDTVVGALRPNTVSQTAARAVGFPSGIRSVDYVSLAGARTAASPTFQRAGENGTALIYSPFATDTPIYSYYIAPEDFYEAASTLRLGDPLKVAVGRQIPNTVTAWELNNELLQVRPAFGSRFDLQYRVWLSTGAWSAWETLTIRAGLSAVDLPAPHTITVLRNSPEVVAIRLLASSSRSPVQIDLTLRRGARYVSAVYSQVTGTIPVVRCTHSTIGTVGGFYWFGAGYGGFFASPVSINGSSGAFSPNLMPNDAWQFGFGAVDNPPAGSDDINQAIHEYFWAASEKQSVVAQ